MPVNIDFLTTRYEGPENSIMREVKDELRAIQVDGLGLAFVNPLRIEVSCTLLSGGRTEETIRVCSHIPYVVLKAFSIENRREPKDAYDLVYVLQNAFEDVREFARCATTDELKEPSFLSAVRILQNHFRTIDKNGAAHYAQFTWQPGNAEGAFAVVRNFLRAWSDRWCLEMSIGGRPEKYPGWRKI